DSFPANSLEDDEVAEFPMQDGSGLKVFEIPQFETDAPPSQAEPGRRLEEGLSARPAPSFRGYRPDFLEPTPLPVVGEDHRQAGGSAIRRRHLLDVRDPAAAARRLSHCFFPRRP